MMQWKMQKNWHPLSSVAIRGRLLCNLRFADDIGPLREVVEKKSNNSLKDWKKQLLGKHGNQLRQSKFFVNSIKPRPSTNMWMKWKTLEEVDQLKYLGSTQTKGGTSIKEVNIRLAQGLSHDKASSTLEKQIHRFSRNVYTLQITCLVNPALWM